MPVATKLAVVPGRLAEAPARIRKRRQSARRAAKAGFVAGRTLERGRRAGQGAAEHAPSPALFAACAAAGAGAGYFFDPQNGKRRRHVARDRLLALGRRGAGEAGRKAKHAAGVTKGAVTSATPSPRAESDLNDPALARKVESQIFRPEGAPKGKVDVNVENGVVFLRGRLDSEAEAAALVTAAA